MQLKYQLTQEKIVTTQSLILQLLIFVTLVHFSNTFNLINATVGWKFHRNGIFTYKSVKLTRKYNLSNRMLSYCIGLVISVFCFFAIFV